MGVLQPRDHARLALEALAPGRIRRRPALDDLNRDMAIHAGVVRSIDCRHAAAAQLLEQLVRAKLPADRLLHLAPLCGRRARRRSKSRHDAPAGRSAWLRTCEGI